MFKYNKTCILFGPQYVNIYDYYYLYLYKNTGEQASMNRGGYQFLTRPYLQRGRRRRRKRRGGEL
jgi:hypothetical protein